MEYYKRGFLNKDEGLALFETCVRFQPDDNHLYINANVTLSDCSRQITLDFDVSDYRANDYEDAMHKLNTLINELQEFSTELTIAKIEFDIAKAANEASGTEATQA